MYFNSPILKIFCIVVTLLLTLAHDQDYDIFHKRLDQFRLNLFHRVENQNSQKNVIISPLSVQSVIGMLYMGAEGETAAELAQTFAMNDKNTFSLYFHRVLNYLRRIQGVTIAKKFYIDENAIVKKEYRDQIQNYFFSSIETVEFLHAEQTAKSINEWVKKETKDLIPQLVHADTFDENIHFFLVNTITFSGEWKYKFNKADTEPADFYLNKNKTVKVLKMAQSGRFVTQYHAGLRAKSLILPYAKGGLSFVIFLPKTEDDFYYLEGKIKDIDLSDLRGGSMDYIHVLLPKFKAEFEFDFKDTLQNMGLRKLFSDSAELNGIFEAKFVSLHIYKFLHKAVINVDEKGSTAADLSGFKFNAPVFDVDMPFIYFIKDDRDLVLFSGSYKGPDY